MKNTKTLLGKDARKAVMSGVEAIYGPVSRTLGPKAARALLYRTYNRGSRITDDGVTVSEVQEPKDPFVKLAADTFKEMAKRTVEKVGDGTTTTIVIGGKLMRDVYRQLNEGVSDFTSKGMASAKDISDNILASAALVKDEITKRATKVETLEQLEKVATISVKDPELGKVIAKMAWEVGVDGYIDVTEGYKGEIETEVNKGMRFMAKVPNKAFVNNPKRYEMVAEDCPVFVTNHAFDNGGDVAPLLAAFNKSTSKIVVIAPSFSTNVLVNMVNAYKQGYFIYPVAAPSLRTEQFEDLAVYCDAKFFDKAKGMQLRNARFEDTGFLEKLIVKDTDMREEAVATGGRGTKERVAVGAEGAAEAKPSAVAERIEQLKAQLTEQKDVPFKKLMERRIASMGSSVGVIRVGDSTQASSLYRKLKIEDAVYATKAALRGGYVKGGGLCLREIADDLVRDGVLAKDDLLIEALKHPYELIQASVSGGLEIGPDVIDPAEAVYWAVEHATQVVAQLATVEVLTPEVDEVAPGDGYMAIAAMIREFVISQKLHLGQIKENEIEMERDRLGGLTADEKVMLDEG